VGGERAFGYLESIFTDAVVRVLECLGEEGFRECAERGGF
jgi:hypothetical protein